MSPYQALKTATVEPARYFGRSDVGVLKPGNIADIILLDRNPLKDISALRSVSAVVLHGAIIPPAPATQRPGDAAAVN